MCVVHVVELVRCFICELVAGMRSFTAPGSVEPSAPAGHCVYVLLHIVDNIDTMKSRIVPACVFPVLHQHCQRAHFRVFRFDKLPVLVVSSGFTTSYGHPA